jgi:hypothetical protein
VDQPAFSPKVPRLSDRSRGLAPVNAERFGPVRWADPGPITAEARARHALVAELADRLRRAMLPTSQANLDALVGLIHDEGVWLDRAFAAGEERDQILADALRRRADQRLGVRP